MMILYWLGIAGICLFATFVGVYGFCVTQTLFDLEK